MPERKKTLHGEKETRRALWLCGLIVIAAAPLTVLFQISRFSILFTPSLNESMFYDAFRSRNITNITTENALLNGTWKQFAKLYLRYGMEDHLYLYTVLSDTAKHHPDPHLHILLGGLAEQYGSGAPAPWFRRALEEDGGRLTDQERAFCQARLSALEKKEAVR